jgi:hypothetical protein
MGFKQRVGNFFLLFGIVGLLIFAASVLTPSRTYDVSAFIAGVLLFGLGLNFRLSKSSGPPREAFKAAAPAAKAAGKPAGKGGPPKAGPPGGGAPKRQGLLSNLLKGPPPTKTAPKPPPGGGGPPPKKK